MQLSNDRRRSVRHHDKAVSLSCFMFHKNVGRLEAVVPCRKRRRSFGLGDDGDEDADIVGSPSSRECSWPWPRGSPPIATKRLLYSDVAGRPAVSWRLTVPFAIPLFRGMSHVVQASVSPIHWSNILGDASHLYAGDLIPLLAVHGGAGHWVPNNPFNHDRSRSRDLWTPFG
jgi:hypothetical protein